MRRAGFVSVFALFAQKSTVFGAFCAVHPARRPTTSPGANGYQPDGSGVFDCHGVMPISDFPLRYCARNEPIGSGTRLIVSPTSARSDLIFAATEPKSMPSKVIVG